MAADRHLLNADNEILSYDDRQKRSTSLTDVPPNNPNITIKIYLCDCRPQHYDEHYYYRAQPRSINNDSPFNQRYNYNPNPSYDSVMRNPLDYNNNYDRYYQARPSFGLGPRVRGPAGAGVITPDENSRTNERNNYNNAGIDVTLRIDSDVAEHKTHATRILNSPKQPPREHSSHDIMLGDQSSDFVFPGAVHNPVITITPTPPPPNLTVRFRPDMKKLAAKCKSTFCESVDDYPGYYIHNVLKYNATKFDDLLGVDEIHTDVSIHTRIGTVDGSPMCRSSENVVRPQVAQNKDDEWLYIVNSDDKVQGIRVEICEKENAACEMSTNFPVNYVTECKQKYIYRKMLALDPEGNPVPDSFRIPSCCSCYFRNDIQSRFGVKSKRDTSPIKRYTRN
ncbi:spatzle [Carabus blaptoides fortunei]